MSESVLVLGANGRIGRLVCEAFASAGWRVIAQARRPLAGAAHSGITHLGVPVTQTDALAAGAAGAAVVVNAMNPVYTRWDEEALPLNSAAIACARALGATLMLPGNVYIYGSPMPHEITERTPERPTNRKGEIRCRMEAAIRREAPRSIVLRAGDFYGGPGTGSWMDQAIVKDLPKGRIVYPGPRDLEHAWAYLPDLARTFVLLAEARDRLEPHESFLFPGHTLTGNELVAAITRAARRLGLLKADQDPVVKGIPWTLFRLAGIFNPMLRELVGMSYLWRESHRLAGAKLLQALGTIPDTDVDVAMETALSDLNLTAGTSGSARPT